jgi:site-specific DNA recombinase
MAKRYVRARPLLDQLGDNSPDCEPAPAGQTIFHKIRAFKYLRISDDPYDTCEGIDRQNEETDAVIERRDAVVVGTFTDNDISAMKGRRPDYEAMMEQLADGQADVIVVLRSDRLYRQLRELLDLTKVLIPHGVFVWCARSGDIDLSTADGRLHANLLGAVSQHESEVKGERVSDAAHQRAKRGRFNGGARPFGYRQRDTHLVFIHRRGITSETERPTGPLVAVPDEVEVIVWAYRKIMAGGSLGDCVRHWQQEGVRGPKGAAPSTQMVRDVLLRTTNAGICLSRGEIVTGTPVAPTIIDRETWYIVAALLLDPARRSNRGRPATTLLGGLMRCSVCQEAIDGAARGSYACASTHVRRQRDWIDALLSRLVVAKVTQERARLRRPVSTALAYDVGKLATRADMLRANLAGLAPLLTIPVAEGGLDPAGYAAAFKTLTAELATITSKLARKSGRPSVAAMADAPDVAAYWEAADVATRRTIIKEIIGKITLTPTTTKQDVDAVDVEWAAGVVASTA